MGPLRLGYNAVPEQARGSINDVFSSGQFSPGPKVKEFEERFARLHKAEHAVFVNSGTDALRLGLLALKEKYGWPEGAGVAVPALTFVATVNVILQAGLKPFFVDVGMYDYTMNISNLERRMETAKTDLVALMPVHLFGQPCNPDIFDLAKAIQLRILEDSCETILNPLQGDVSCHSTYMAHHLTTGVGGMAVTSDMELNLLMRSYANHGRNVTYLPGYFQPELGKELLRCRFRFDRIGYSCRGTEFEAALGLAQLDLLPEHVAKRRRVFENLYNRLLFFEEFRLRRLEEGNTAMMFPIVLRENSPIDKYDLCLYLEEKGIETRDMMPITNQPCYRDLVQENDFPVAQWINRNGFYIPCHPAMTTEDVLRIGTFLDAYIDKRAKVA